MTEKDDLREAIEDAAAEVAMWPDWKRRLSLAAGEMFIDGDPDRYVNIPRAVAAIDKEIERLRARRDELLRKAEGKR